MRRALLLIVLATFFLLSGLAGAALGGASAQAGWWLAGVSLVFLYIGIRAVRAERT